MPPTTTTRRTFVRSIGAGAIGALAGCLSSSPGNSDATAGSDEPTLPDADEVDVDRIAADPTDVPAPVDWDEPRHHEVSLTAEEVTAEVEPGVTFDYMTFDGRIPGPMIRVRRGDTVTFRLANPEENRTVHNLDFHAVDGPGGGAEHTTIEPGETAEIRYRAMYPGAFIYHCAIPNMDHHISAGMFGAILVEPEDGLPEVDREFYFGQHELYTEGDTGEEGHHAFDHDAAAAEEPTYVLLNGEAYAFTEDGYGPVRAEVGETARVYFANGGPNLTSAWHPIGNVWSRLYRDGDLTTEPDRYVETAPIAPGTVAAGEMEFPVPGPVRIVDHALSRVVRNDHALSRVVRKGLLGVIDVDGDPDEDVYDPDP